MALSVNNNSAALTALQNLNATNEQLTAVQGRISTGLKVSNAKDDASIWSIAQGQRADIGALGEPGAERRALLLNLQQQGREGAFDAGLEER